jgi:SH3 domain protein|tara:strand:+ start:572 stop:1267 length:696 start_codon:yes stop_codon:yes gene_type:complete
MLLRLNFLGVFLVNSLIGYLLVGMALLTISPFSFADEAYIRDTLYVPLRGGESSEHRIIHRGIKSGTPLERLETNEQTGYTRVRTGKGLEGWLLTQYLVDEPIASTQLDIVKSELQSLDTKHQQTLLSLKDVKEARKILADQNELLAEDLATITTLSANVVVIDEQNKRLSEERDVLLQKIKNLNEITNALSDDRAQQWFLRGAGVILIGLMFGFWFSRRIYHKRYSGGWA